MYTWSERIYGVGGWGDCMEDNFIESDLLYPCVVNKKIFDFPCFFPLGWQKISLIWGFGSRFQAIFLWSDEAWQKVDLDRWSLKIEDQFKFCFDVAPSRCPVLFP